MSKLMTGAAFLAAHIIAVLILIHAISRHWISGVPEIILLSVLALAAVLGQWARRSRNKRFFEMTGTRW